MFGSLFYDGFNFNSGEAHVYTLGDIGEHKVVSTKLPQIGRTRGAQISSGNNTTRLLGKYTYCCLDQSVSKSAKIYCNTLRKELHPSFKLFCFVSFSIIFQMEVFRKSLACK